MAMSLVKAGRRLAKFKTTQGLARFLEREGVKGVPNDPHACPVAQWLTKVTEQPKAGAFWGCLSTDGFTTHRPGEEPADEDQWTPTPEVVRAFMPQFDARGFPDLIKE